MISCMPMISYSTRFQMGETGTIPFSMSKESTDFPGAACDSKMDAGDGN